MSRKVAPAIEPVDFLTAAATEDKDYLRLSDGEWEAMCERLDNVHDIHEEMVQALERLAEAIRALSAGTPTVREIEALRGLAMAHAARVSEAADLLNELQRLLADRPLDDLLRALTEPEAGRRKRKSSKRIKNQ